MREDVAHDVLVILGLSIAEVRADARVSLAKERRGAADASMYCTVRAACARRRIGCKLSPHLTGFYYDKSSEPFSYCTWEC